MLKNSSRRETKGTDYSVPGCKLLIHGGKWPWTERSVPFVFAPLFLTHYTRVSRDQRERFKEIPFVASKSLDTSPISAAAVRRAFRANRSSAPVIVWISWQ